MCKVKKPTEFKSLLEVTNYFKNEKRCYEAIEKWFWNGTIKCPLCECDRIYRFKDGKLLKCKKCRQQFTIKSGTIFEQTKLPLVKWFAAIYLLLGNKRGISSQQLATMIDVTPKTAWLLSHKIRSLMKQPDDKLEGIVQVDECFCGGVNGNRHLHKRVKNRPDKTFQDKVTVIGFLEEGSRKLKCEVIKNVKSFNLRPAVLKHVKSGTTLVTDDWGYSYLYDNYNTTAVQHAAKKWVSPEGYSTNGIENAWSHLKRMFIGTYNFVTRKHFSKYLNEYVYRFNTRTISNGEKMKLIFSNINQTLTYQKLVNG